MLCALRQTDFNIDLLNTELSQGSNTITIRAVDGLGNESIQTVQVDYSDNDVWPIPYDLNWATVTDLQDVCQVVDGLWSMSSAGIRTDLLGYDRDVAMGDQMWTDYELELHFEIHSVDFDGTGPVSGTPGLGVILRWPGHLEEGVQRQLSDAARRELEALGYIE